MFFIPIVLIIGFNNLFAATADKHELPDDGRLAVGKCLDANFLRNKNRIREVEDYLYGLCNKTRTDHYHFRRKLQGIEKTPEKAYDDLKACLKEHYELDELKKAKKPDEANTSETANPTNDEIKSTEANASDKANKLAEAVITRYTKFASYDAMRAKGYPEIIQVVVGLCGEHEWVKYEELDKTNQPKAINCLRNCAVRLFENFEWLVEVIKSEHQHYLEQLEIEKSSGNEKQAPGETSDKHINQGDNKIQKEDNLTKDEDDDEEGAESEGSSENLIKPSDNQSKPREDKHSIMQWFKRIKHLLHAEKVHVEYKKGIHNYIQTCENLNVHDIKTLTAIGKLWAGHYIDNLEMETEKFHFYLIKEDVLYAFNSYLHCTMWVCAMGERDDTPFIEYVNDTSYEMSRTASKFINRYHPTQSKTPDSIDIKLS